jgi:undecaprenyl-diphosphatase
MITVGGSTIFWFLLIIVFWLGKKRKATTLLFLAFVADSMTSFSFKILFNRLRPEEVFPGIKALDYETPSFPSGHSERAFSGAAVLSSLYKNFRYAFYFLAFLVAISRIFTGVHFPLDVIYGSLNGLLVGYIVREVHIGKLF